MREAKMKYTATTPTVKSKSGSQHFAAGFGGSGLLSNIDDKF